jgi:hypothetical protein
MHPCACMSHVRIQLSLDMDGYLVKGCMARVHVQENGRDNELNSRLYGTTECDQ